MWNLRALFVAAALVAVHFALRTATIRYETESFVECAPLALAVLFGVGAGATGMSYARIFAGAALVSVLSAGGWAYERVAKTAAVDFMRDDRVFSNYGSDVQLNLIFVAMIVVISTALGGTSGAVVRYIKWWPVIRYEWRQ